MSKFKETVDPVIIFSESTKALSKTMSTTSNIKSNNQMLRNNTNIQNKLFNTKIRINENNKTRQRIMKNITNGSVASLEQDNSILYNKYKLKK